MQNRRGMLMGLGAGLGLGLNGAVFSVRAAGKALPFYAATGSELTCFALDASAASLQATSTVMLPAAVQYAWPAHGFLYVVSSDGVSGHTHHATAFRIDAASGALTQVAQRALAARPIHCSVDHDGRFLLIATNMPSAVTVHALADDGGIGAALPQAPGLDFGIYAHQVRATPSNRSVALVTRGNDAAGGKPEDPGAIKLFRFEDGKLSNMASIAPQGGLGFGPRHLDFHPTRLLAYVSLERQNALDVYRILDDGGFSAAPLFRVGSLADADAKAKYPGQTAGPIHLHPNGRFAYQTNRGSGTRTLDGQAVSNGGENDVVVYALDPQTGAPTAIQHVPSHGFEPRTFTIDPSGTLLIAANQMALQVAENGALRSESAGLSFYRIGPDGRLTFLHKQDVATTRGSLFWSGLLTMP